MSSPKHDAVSTGRPRRRAARRAGWILVALAAVALVSWTIWSEFHPRAERELRVEVQQRLEAWFPGQMEAPEHARGFFGNGGSVASPTGVAVVLVHGLDEPGGIWTELKKRLNAEGIEHVEFRYPNDQAIDASADELARRWHDLKQSSSVALVGHSMGGLVIRDFVSRHRYPASSSAAALEGPEVSGVILIGTPNHGSEWARLRAWMELREYAADIPAGRFSLFAALRDGTGAAKIDLRPGSRFLDTLNARPWPDSVPVRIIGGRIADPTPLMQEQLEAASDRLDLPELERTIGQMWAQGGEAVGDGAVPVSSLPMPGADPPLILEASHRGLIADMPWRDGEPPAIGPIIRILERWQVGDEN